MIFWRIRNNLKQNEIAERLGITNAHYCNIEKAKSDPSHELLLKFKEEFKIADGEVFELFKKEEVKDSGETL